MSGVRRTVWDMHQQHSVAPTTAAPPQLTPRERAVLDIEAAHPRHSAAKERAIERVLRVSPVRFYQLLDRLCATDAALAADPILVRRVLRLQRARDGRAA